MAKTVIGLMDNLGDAQAVVRELVESGIAQDDIGFMANQKHQLPSTACHSAQAKVAVAIMRRHDAVDKQGGVTAFPCEWRICCMITNLQGTT
jgi:hypothetical protein